MDKQTSLFKGRIWRYPFNWLLVAIFLSIMIYLVWGGFQVRDKKSNRLIVYAYSTQEEVLTQGIFPAFEQAWEAETGEDIAIEGLFGPSGTLSLQITEGAPADIAIFSNQRHIDWLKFNKSVRRDTEPIMIASTPLVIITRPGNSANIADFADLTLPGIKLLHADPGSSGAGEWSVLAEYGSAYLVSGDHDSAEAQVKNIWQNVRLVGSSARANMTLFELGACDALVTYEQDAYLARERGVPLEIVSPPRTILAMHYAVIVDENVTSHERPVVEAFLDFIQSDQGQQILSRYYLRVTTIESDVLPALIQPFTVEDLGGWTQAHNTLIEDLWIKEIKPYLALESANTLLGTAK